MCIRDSIYLLGDTIACHSEHVRHVVLFERVSIASPSDRPQADTVTDRRNGLGNLRWKEHQLGAREHDTVNVRMAKVRFTSMSRSGPSLMYASGNAAMILARFRPRTLR
eukprot:TRINITY_DN1658_c0_g1_i17.p1 TRINITY_DN1658_c0_g1~~TRINITY_DN1658_c0_g1_i17.p1  ORF type:complete len:109 (+),score=6.82 TRINITY_DN1658_c0_g1_i17:122-448(+)